MTAEDAADEVDEAGGKSMVLCHQMLAMTHIEVGVQTSYMFFLLHAWKSAFAVAYIGCIFSITRAEL